MNVPCYQTHHLDRNLDNDPDSDLDYDPDHFALCKRDISAVFIVV